MIEPNSTLVINLDGVVVERYTQSALDRVTDGLTGQSSQNEIRFYDLLEVLKATKNDDRIKKVYLRFDNLQIGYAQARELSMVIHDVKKSGKEVVAYADNYDQKQYLIASAATKVYLDPEGSVLLEGIGGYRQYFRKALEDKLGVNVHLFRVGEFKSAAEPFIRDSASNESKEADLYWMSDIWNRYLKDISTFRNIPLEKITHHVNHIKDDVLSSNGNLAFMATKQNLVDGLMTEEMVDRSLGQKDDSSSPPEVMFGDYLDDLKFKNPSLMQQVAVVVAQGEIVDQNGSSSEIDGEGLSEEIRSVRENPNVKALVLRVDSPGGAVFASEKIRREIELFKKTGRPVVASMGNTAASGGYWISMNADKIVADASTITGSIGIFGLIPDFSKTMEKIGVTTDGVGTTDMAGAFTLGRPLSQDMSKVIQSIIDHGYLQFINRVSKARSLPIQNTDSVARGRVWSGQQALDRKLVDSLGGLSVAIEEAKSLAKLDNARVLIVEPALSPFDNFLTSLGSSKVFVKMSNNAPWTLALFKNISSNPTASMIKNDVMKPVSFSKPKAYAHCLCGIQ